MLSSINTFRARDKTIAGTEIKVTIIATSVDNFNLNILVLTGQKGRGKNIQNICIRSFKLMSTLSYLMPLAKRKHV